VQRSRRRKKAEKERTEDGGRIQRNGAAAGERRRRRGEGMADDQPSLHAYARRIRTMRSAACCVCFRAAHSPSASLRVSLSMAPLAAAAPQEECANTAGGPLQASVAGRMRGAQRSKAGWQAFPASSRHAATGGNSMLLRAAKRSNRSGDGSERTVTVGRHGYITPSPSLMPSHASLACNGDGQALVKGADCCPFPPFADACGACAAAAALPRLRVTPRHPHTRTRMIGPSPVVQSSCRMRAR